MASACLLEVRQAGGVVGIAADREGAGGGGAGVGLQGFSFVQGAAQVGEKGDEVTAAIGEHTFRLVAVLLIFLLGVFCGRQSK